MAGINADNIVNQPTSNIVKNNLNIPPFQDQSTVTKPDPTPQPLVQTNSFGGK